MLSTYADDTTYVVSNKQRDRNQEKIVMTLEKLRRFLNGNKCMLKQMRGRTNGNPPSLIVEKEPGVMKKVDNSSYSRILGTNVQGNLLWSSHQETGERALFP